MSAKKGITNTLVWILMGLLILGLGGFGVTNLNGSIDSVGRVGETEIDLQTYARNLQNEIQAEAAARRTPVPFQTARELGLDQRVLGQLVQAAAFEEETRLMGVSIGDQFLRDQILAIPAFQGINGEFDRDAYRFTLDRQNMSEAEFEEDIRNETARTLLQGAVLAGVEMPEAYIDALMTYVGEERTVTYATQGRAALTTGLPVPTEADLIAYHQSNLPSFTTPLTKRITYAWLTPAMIIDSIEIDEQSLRELYEDRSAEYNQPERRLVERLGFGSTAEAEDAAGRVASGELTFDALIEERGLNVADADMGDVSRDDLGSAADPVFAADSGEVVGPVDTNIGPTLFRINGILSAQTVSFEEAEPALRDELAGDRARRVIDQEADGLADLIAAGATLEELANESDMELGEINWHPGVTDGIAAYDSFRGLAETLTESDFPEIEQLEDEGIFAMRLEGIEEPRILPLEDVRATVEAGWRQGAVTAALRAQLEPQLSQLSGDGDFAALGLTDTTTTDVSRSGFRADTPPEFIDTVFALEPGEVSILEGNERIFVLRVDAIAPPDPQEEDMIRLNQVLGDDGASSLAQDLFALLSADIRGRAGVELDQQALNAVHANFQ